MSAFLVSKAHIDLMVDVARWDQRPYGECRLALPPHHYEFKVNGVRASTGWANGEANGWLNPAECADQLGRALWLANIESLEARYPEDRDDPAARLEAAAYVAPARPRLFGVKPAEACAEIAMILKQLDCYDYQASEVDRYGSSWAQDVTNRLRKHAYGRLPGYEKAPWGLGD